MERNLAEMRVVMEKWGMRMHWGKTKEIMVRPLCVRYSFNLNWLHQK